MRRDVYEDWRDRFAGASWPALVLVQACALAVAGLFLWFALSACGGM